MKIVWGLTIAFLFFAAIIDLKPIKASDENETKKQLALSPSLDLSGVTNTALIDSTLKRDPNKTKKKQNEGLIKTEKPETEKTQKPEIEKRDAPQKKKSKHPDKIKTEKPKKKKSDVKIKKK